jgi:hypothetical protein
MPVARMAYRSRDRPARHSLQLTCISKVHKDANGIDSPQAEVMNRGVLDLVMEKFSMSTTLKVRVVTQLIARSDYTCCIGTHDCVTRRKSL